MQVAQIQSSLYDIKMVIKRLCAEEPMAIPHLSEGGLISLATMLSRFPVLPISLCLSRVFPYHLLLVSECSSGLPGVWTKSCSFSGKRRPRDR